MLSDRIMHILLAMTSSSGTVASPVAVPIQLEMVAVIAASIGGALTAKERRLDPVGCIGLAIACSLGGGLLRDMILQVGDVYILKQPLALPMAMLTAAVVFLFPRFVANQDRLIAILDIFAVGLYAATGADKAMVYGFEPLVCVTMGFFTAVGGGMVRDICLGQTPAIFQQSNFYAVASVAGAISYVALVEAAHLSKIFALVVCGIVTMGLRWASVRFDITSPTEIDLRKVADNVKKPRREDVKREGR